MSRPEIHAALYVLTVFGGIGFALCLISSRKDSLTFSAFIIWALLWAGLAATR